jgi:hypothetical protein
MKHKTSPLARRDRPFTVTPGSTGGPDGAPRARYIIAWVGGRRAAGPGKPPFVSIPTIRRADGARYRKLWRRRRRQFRRNRSSYERPCCRSGIPPPSRRRRVARRWRAGRMNNNDAFSSWAYGLRPSTQAIIFRAVGARGSRKAPAGRRLIAQRFIAGYARQACLFLNRAGLKRPFGPLEPRPVLIRYDVPSKPRNKIPGLLACAPAGASPRPATVDFRVASRLIDAHEMAEAARLPELPEFP